MLKQDNVQQGGHVPAPAGVILKNQTIDTASAACPRTRGGDPEPSR